MTKNGWTSRIAAGVLVALLIGFNSWVGANIVDLREQVARVETKLDMLMHANGTN
jgi:hypothetical protein